MMRCLVLLLIASLHSSLVHAQTVRINKDCLIASDSYTITFRNVNPQDTDWVGIIPSSENTNSFSNFLDWAWTCGSQDCGGSASQGSIVFRASVLPVGTYRAVLARDDDGTAPWAAYAVSSRFRVATSCAPSTPTAPVPKPAPKPVPRPVPVAAPGSNAVAQEHLRQARNEIRNLIADDKKLAPQFLRLAFHDCIGGCDGCIDLGNADNAGIEPAIDALQPIVNRHALEGVTRADVWALSAMVGADVRQRQNSRISTFTLDWWGRVNCESAGQTCKGANGQTVECSAKKGPHRIFPNIHMHTHELYGFFRDNFGFNQRETVAIMGAHTLGVVREEDFDIDGSNGWVLDNDIMANNYYKELVVGGPNDDIEDLINDAPAWRRVIQNGQRHWEGRPEGTRIIMLNTDIALVRELDDSNMDKNTGRVTCTFEDNTSTDSLPVCPHVEGALQIAAEFGQDNIGWLREFRNVLDRMLTNGYRRNDCNDDVCKLQRRT